MKGADLPAVAAISPARNGAHRPGKRHSTATKRSNGHDAGADSRPAPQPLAAPLTATPGAPVDLPMWPLHMAVWFQPEPAPPATPAWSGLSVERRSRIPSPDFVHASVMPLDCPAPTENRADPLTPAAHPLIPQSDAAPIGWDPRTICRKGEQE
jgi:hypothetical protein